MIKALSGAVIMLHLSLAVAHAQGADASTASRLGYPSIDAALEALKKKPGVSISTQDGWTIATDRPANTIWSFTPFWNDAHPAVVRRTLVKKDGAIFVETKVLCHAAKSSCDKLVAEFNELNNRMRQSVQPKRDP